MKKPRKWKVNTGIVLGVIGGAMVTAASGCPVPEWSPWLSWVGGLLVTVGGGLATYGMADRVDKAAKTANVNAANAAGEQVLSAQELDAKWRALQEKVAKLSAEKEKI